MQSEDRQKEEKEESGMIYGYVRISTPRQSLERQIRNIRRDYPDAVICAEVYSGARADRPVWRRLYARAKDGDTIVFDSVSRMSRDAEEGFAAYEALYRRGVALVYLKEPYISTETFRAALAGSKLAMTGGAVDEILAGVTGYLMLVAREQIRLAFVQAEKEVKDLRQRTREGLETARLAGKQIGQPKGAKLVTKKSLAGKQDILTYSRAFNGTMTDKEVMRLTGLSRNTYYKYKRELTEAETKGD